MMRLQGAGEADFKPFIESGWATFKPDSAQTCTSTIPGTFVQHVTLTDGGGRQSGAQDQVTEYQRQEDNPPSAAAPQPAAPPPRIARTIASTGIAGELVATTLGASHDRPKTTHEDWMIGPGRLRSRRLHSGSGLAGSGFASQGGATIAVGRGAVVPHGAVSFGLTGACGHRNLLDFG